MPPRRKIQPVPSLPDAPRSADLRFAVRDSVDGMDWLSDSDQAMAELALKIAGEIEQAQERADLMQRCIREAEGDVGLIKRIQKLEAMCDVTKTVGWLGPQLQGVLRDLGGTPAARKAMRPDRPIGGRLAALRERTVRASDAPSGDGADAAEDLD